MWLTTTISLRCEGSLDDVAAHVAETLGCERTFDGEDWILLLDEHVGAMVCDNYLQGADELDFEAYPYVLQLGAYGSKEANLDEVAAECFTKLQRAGKCSLMMVKEFGTLTAKWDPPSGEASRG